MKKPLKKDLSKQAQKSLLNNKAFQIISASAVIKELGNKKGLYKGTLKNARKLAAQLSRDNPSKTYIIHNKSQYYCQFKAGTIHAKVNPVTMVNHKNSSLVIDKELEGKVKLDSIDRVTSSCKPARLIRQADNLVKSQALCNGKTVEIRKKERLAYYG